MNIINDELRTMIKEALTDTSIDKELKEYLEKLLVQIDEVDHDKEVLLKATKAIIKLLDKNEIGPEKPIEVYTIVKLYISLLPRDVLEILAKSAVMDLVASEAVKILAKKAKDNSAFEKAESPSSMLN